MTISERIFQWWQERCYAKCARVGHREQTETRDILRKAASREPGDSMAIVCYESRDICDRCGDVLRPWFCYARGNAFGLTMTSEQKFKFDNEGELVL